MLDVRPVIRTGFGMAKHGCPGIHLDAKHSLTCVSGAPAALEASRGRPKRAQLLKRNSTTFSTELMSKRGDMLLTGEVPHLGVSARGEVVPHVL